MKASHKLASLFATAALAASALTLGVQPAQAATLTAATISSKLAKAGLGCKDLKATKDKILYSGKRWTCTIKGNKTNIEFYTTGNLKKAGKYLCDSGLDLALVTDKKTWVIATGDSSVDAAVAKALAGTIVTACKL